MGEEGETSLLGCWIDVKDPGPDLLSLAEGPSPVPPSTFLILLTVNGGGGGAGEVEWVDGTVEDAEERHQKTIGEKTENKVKGLVRRGGMASKEVRWTHDLTLAVTRLPGSRASSEVSSESFSVEEATRLGSIVT